MVTTSPQSTCIVRRLEVTRFDRLRPTAVREPADALNGCRWRNFSLRNCNGIDVACVCGTNGGWDAEVKIHGHTFVI